MFERIKNRLMRGRVSAYVSDLEKSGSIGLDKKGEYGIFETPFMLFVSEHVAPDDIEEFLDTVVNHVQEMRMKSMLESQRYEIIKEKISDLIIECGE